MKKIMAWLFSASVLLSGCSLKAEPKLFRYQASFFGVFDTVTTVVGYARDQETFTVYVEKLKEELTEYHQLYDIYQEYPEIQNLKTVNDQAGQKPVQVDERILKLLEFSAELYEKTDEAVNVAMGSVLSIWHEHRMQGIDDPLHASLPDTEELERAAEHTDMKDVVLNREEGTVFLADPDMSLDVGAIAKGYAVEQVCQSLENQGITGLLVNVGGNTRAIGTKPGGEPWKVGVQNPDLEAEEKTIHTVELSSGQCLVQSGGYQRYYTVDGLRYHHIIQPELLAPWNKYAAVAIICSDSGMADALSTAVFNMEPEEGEAFVESLPGVEALWIYPDGSERESSGFFEEN